MIYRGIFDKTIYFNPMSRYSIISVKTDDSAVPESARSSYKYRDHLIRFTATGFNLPQSDSVTLELTGEWVKDEKYGYQLQVETCREIVPPTPEGVRKYLASGLIKGIGDITAAAIVSRFGIRALDILEHNPEQLLEIKGITKERLKEIEASYAENRVLRDLMTFLSPFQVTPATAMKIHNYFGDNSLSIIRESPFELCRISGFGFSRVDEIVSKTGGRMDDPQRIKGAIIHSLNQKCTEGGHLFINRNTLCRSALIKLNKGVALSKHRLKTDNVENQLQDLILHGDVVSYRDSIYPKRSFFLENDTAERIASMLMAKEDKTNITVEMDNVTKSLCIHLSAKQKSAVEMVFRFNLSIITGGPGTGKTTILKTVLELYRRLHPESKIMLAAPTGRASRRMAESTGFNDAKTLHSALGLISGNEEDDYLNSNEAIDADMVIIDEFSMVDMWLAMQLFTRLKPSTKVLLVGDADQLPSVGPGNVFRELISCGLVPVTVLDEIFRQARDSRIAYNARFINENETDLYYGDDFVFIDCETQQEVAKVIQEIYLKEVAKSGVEQVQILSPYRKDGDASADKLNQAIREMVNPYVPETPEFHFGSRIFRIGDKVMQTKNKGDISNGDVGFIRSFNKSEDGESTVTIEFSGARTVRYDISKMDSIVLAYAMTVHKAMGSEYDTVIMPILADHSVMLYRNLLYTGVSRAKQRIYLVGEKDILFIAIHRNRIDKRNTLLGQRIAQYLKVKQLNVEKARQALPPEQLKLTG